MAYIFLNFSDLTQCINGKSLEFQRYFFPMIINFLIFYNIIYPNGQLSKYVFCKMKVMFILIFYNVIYPNGQLSKYVFCKMKLMFILNSIYIAESVIK